jgi:hypothetical protein
VYVFRPASGPSASPARTPAPSVPATWTSRIEGLTIRRDQKCTPHFAADDVVVVGIARARRENNYRPKSSLHDHPMAASIWRRKIRIDLTRCPLDVLLGVLSNRATEPAEIFDHLIDGRRSVLSSKSRPSAVQTAASKPWASAHSGKSGM